MVSRTKYLYRLCRKWQQLSEFAPFSKEDQKEREMYGMVIYRIFGPDIPPLPEPWRRVLKKACDEGLSKMLDKLRNQKKNM